MWRYINYCFIVFLLACSAQAAPTLTTTDGAFSIQDGESVILKGVLVDRTADSYIFVRNTWAGSKILPVYTAATIKCGWILEITGHTAAIGQQRIVVADQIRLYVDERGNPLPPMPYNYLIGYAPDPIDITSTTINTMVSNSENDIPQPPTSDPIVGTPMVLTPTEGTIAWAKTLADGGDQTTLTNKIITRNWADYFYVEDDDRSCGIRIEKANHGRVKGDRVDVTGTLATDTNGEHYISASSVSLGTSNNEIPKPLGVNNNSLGGGDFSYVAGPPFSGQIGIAGASGLNNIGLLVRTWGKVSQIDTAANPQWFKINDGSNADLTVAYPPYGYSLNDYAYITGISSISGDFQRVLRPQPLTCTVSPASGQNSPTNTTPVNFTVSFSEPVSGFTADDLALSGIDGAIKTISGSGTTYNVEVSIPTAGTIVATVPSGVVQDNSGVWNYPSNDTGNSVLFDNLAPTVGTFSVPLYSSSPINITFQASDTGGSGILGLEFYYITNPNDRTQGIYLGYSLESSGTFQV